MGGTDDEPGGSSPGGSAAGGMPDGSGTGGEAGDSLPPLVVTSANLPDATLNQDYLFALEAQGGSGRSYVWNLEEGRLPRGVELSEDGSLSGIPLEGGDFELDVTVGDSDGSSARATLGIHVRQSRWLVFETSLNGDTWVPHVYAVDLTSENFERTDVIGTVPTNHNGLDAALQSFSPDGRFFLYQLFVYSEHVGGEGRLVDLDEVSRIVDSGENGSPVLAINELSDELVKLYGAEWSPDSQRVAFTPLIANAAGHLQIPYRFAYVNVDDVLASPGVSTNLRRRPEGAQGLVDWISLRYRHL